MPTNRSRKSGKAVGRVQPKQERPGGVAAGMVHLVRGTVMSTLAGVRDVGAEVGSVAVTVAQGSIRAARTIGGDIGRLAIDAAEGAIQAADRISGAAGRAANNLVDATMWGVAGIVRQTPGPEQASNNPAPRHGDPQRVNPHRVPPGKVSERPVQAQRKPLARSPQRGAARARPASRRRGAGSS